ncbi:hypothetical protein [Streptomyces sp. JH14]|nr:hypothetical protein [Streptomyces sp. JH14]
MLSLAGVIIAAGLIERIVATSTLWQVITGTVLGRVTAPAVSPAL